MEHFAQITTIKQWLGTGSINIFGIQFSGKDTVGKRLANDLDGKFISSGDILRASGETDQKTGVLTSQESFFNIVLPHLVKPEFSNKPLVLSTIGRWIGEEQPVMKTLSDAGHETKIVILLNISEEEVLRRYEIARDTRNGGREDDINKEKVETRLKWFRDKTLPVIEVYRQMGLLIEVNGEQSRDEVYAEVIQKLYNFSRA
ncbi:nucleoside monophosphate kinase [Candidatus Saccharibacteria bacterium]|nr:nucleoside monophosphate kinase [Candidatus Saccharibacteria bacterium]